MDEFIWRSVFLCEVKQPCHVCANSSLQTFFLFPKQIKINSIKGIGSEIANVYKHTNHALRDLKQKIYQRQILLISFVQ